MFESLWSTTRPDFFVLSSSEMTVVPSFVVENEAEVEAVASDEADGVLLFISHDRLQNLLLPPPPSPLLVLLLAVLAVFVLLPL